MPTPFSRGPANHTAVACRRIRTMRGRRRPIFAYLGGGHGIAGWGLPGGGRSMGGYQLTAIIERERDLFIAHCVELDIARSGSSREGALESLKDAVASFVANAEDAEILRRLTRDVEVTLFEVERR